MPVLSFNPEVRYILATSDTLLTNAEAFASATASERPLYPSVEFLLHTHNLKASDIKATGPGGRLLKGDVLAHIGEIHASAPEAL